MADTKALREKMANLAIEARAKLSEVADNTPEERAAEIEREFDAMMAEHDKLEERVGRMERAEAAQRKLEEINERTAAPVETKQSRAIEFDASVDYRSAFGEYLRHGFGDLPSEMRAALRENRAQSAGTNSEGGFTVPTELIPELIKSMAAYSPLFDENITRQLVTASGNPLTMPTTNDTSKTAVLLAENTAATDNDAVFGQVTLGAYKYTSGLIKVSNELLQDTAINLEAELRGLMAERFGRGVGAALTTGTGSNQPNGIVTAAGAGITGAVSTISFDNLIDLQHSVDPAYRRAPSTAFMFNDSTLQTLRKIKDSEGNYIWQPASVATGAAATILGEQYVINQAMANIGASAVSVLYGDMQKFIVRRARPIDIKRLDERFAEADQVAFVGFVRVDSTILDSAAIKKLTHAAS
jgi:HK97 family phage major capsid protein